MTYWQFHFIYTLPVLVILSLALFFKKIKPSKTAWMGLGLLTLLAIVYTTPWDNYLVYKKVWGYPETGVSMTFGYVPIEEYFFFVVQTFISSFFVFIFIFTEKSWLQRQAPESFRINWFFLIVGTSLCFTFAGLTWSAINIESVGLRQYVYLLLILSWSLPVFCLQWIFGADLLWQNKRLFIIGVAVPTIYFSFVDSLALESGIWHLSPTYTTGVLIANLPIEEALFFVVTNMMVVQGMILFLHPQSARRLTGVFRYGNYLRSESY